MACHLAGAEPLSKPVLEYRYLDAWEQTLEKILIEIYAFSFKKLHLKMS